jgi:hypothetical protein
MAEAHPERMRQKPFKELQHAVDEDLLQRMWSLYSGLSS